MTKPYRFTTFVDEANGFLVIRPIGNMPGPDFAARVIEFYRSIEAPWTNSRIIDGRRHDGYASDADGPLSPLPGLESQPASPIMPMSPLS